MKRFGILLLITLAASHHAQATCSVSTPCTTVTWTNASMTSTVVMNSSGVQISGPGLATIWRCVGTSITCSASAFGSSVWVNLTPNGVTQTTTAGSYIDAAVAYGQSLNYIVTDAWTGGGNGPASLPLVFAMPAAPSAVPGSPTGLAVVLKTS